MKHRLFDLSWKREPEFGVLINRVEVCCDFMMKQRMSQHVDCLKFTSRRARDWKPHLSFRGLTLITTWTKYFNLLSIGSSDCSAGTLGDLDLGLTFFTKRYHTNVLPFKMTDLSVQQITLAIQYIKQMFCWLEAKQYYIRRLPEKYSMDTRNWKNLGEYKVSQNYYKRAQNETNFVSLGSHYLFNFQASNNNPILINIIKFFKRLNITTIELKDLNLHERCKSISGAITNTRSSRSRDKT